MIITSDAPAAAPRRAPLQRAAAVFGVSFAVLLVGAWIPAWSGDEAATAMVVRRTLPEVLRTVEFDPALLPYYLLTNLWAVPSSAAWWLRMLSVVAMAGAVTATSVLAGRLGGARLGAVTAAAMLVLPAVSRYAQDARPYALSVLLIVAVVLCWQGGLATWLQRVTFAVLVAALALVQPYALLIVPVLLVTAAFGPRPGGRRLLVVTAGASLVAAAAVLPYLVVLSRNAIGQPDPAPVTVRNLIEEGLRLPVAVLSPALAAPLAAAVLATAVVGVVVAGRRHGRLLAALLITWMALPPLLLCALQEAGVGPGLVARYWTFCLPALAIAVAVAAEALWVRSRAAAIALLTVLLVLGLPTQVTIRTVDGHLGQRWRDLPRALDHPALRDAPLLVEGWSYRALVSNDRTLADRMVLVVDPASEGRINPTTYGPGSPPFDRLPREHQRIVVLQGERGFTDVLPTRGSFPDFEDVLESYPTLAVRCTYFGEPLGVFTTTAAAPSAEEADQMVRHLSDVAPHRVRCANGAR